MWAILQSNPKFVKFWLGLWCSELGDWIRKMALMYLVLDMSGGSAVAVSINLFCEFGPLVVLGLFVGVYADRWDHRKTMLGAIVLRVVLMALLILAVLIDSLMIVYAVSFFSAIGTVLFRAPSSAFTMRLVPKEQLKSAASLRQMATSSMFLIGPPAGTLLYFWLGTAGALAMAIAFLLLNYALFGAIKLAKLEKTGTALRGPSGVLSEMKDGLRQAWHNKMVRPLLYSNVLFGISSGLSNVLSIFILTEFLGQPKEAFSIFVAVQGGGMLLATFVVPKLKVSRQALLSGGMLVMGLGALGMVSYPHFLLPYSFVVLFAFGMVAFNISFATVLQTTVDISYQGRVSTTLMTVATGVMALTMPIAGWLHELFPVQPILLGAGCSILLGGLLLLVMYKRVPIDSQEKPLAL
ncbi:MFS transporter [Tumebacillus algifaecis]|nr:MFS transporter [Tumebacillus algifaecis]